MISSFQIMFELSVLTCKVHWTSKTSLTDQFSHHVLLPKELWLGPSEGHSLCKNINPPSFPKMSLVRLLNSQKKKKKNLLNIIHLFMYWFLNVFLSEEATRHNVSYTFSIICGLYNHILSDWTKPGTGILIFSPSIWINWWEKLVKDTYRKVTL